MPLCWVWGPGIAVLWSCQRIDVCDSVRLLYLLTYYAQVLTLDGGPRDLCTPPPGVVTTVAHPPPSASTLFRSQ